MRRTSSNASSETKEPEKASHEDEIMMLKSELKEKDKTANDYLERLKYLQAEFDNYRKGAEKERAAVVKYANEGLILKLLDVFESLEKALANIGEDDVSIADGVGLVYKKFKQVLEKEGIRPINAVGEKFDPFKHEALNVETDETKEPNTVVEEYQRGYMLDDRVLRYSKVKVTTR